MEEFNNRACEMAEHVILDFMRTHNLPQWPPEDYWWFALIHIWASAWTRVRNGAPLTVRALNRALLDLGDGEKEIRKQGAHTYLELDNLTFVYREKTFKDGRVAFKIAPHLKGAAFGKCGHTFLDVHGSALELAQRLIDTDRIIPDLKTVCVRAYWKGLQERQIREHRDETAGEFLKDFFHGALPTGVVQYEIADSTPGAADLIRLVVHDEGTPFWRVRLFDIPFDIRGFLQADYVQSFIEQPDLQFGALELYADDETGENIPVARYRPYESETERLGLLDE